MSASWAISRARVDTSLSTFACTRVRSVSSGLVIPAASPGIPDTSSTISSPLHTPNITFFMTVLLTESAGLRRFPHVLPSLLMGEQVDDGQVGDGADEKIGRGDQEADQITSLDPFRRAKEKRHQHPRQDSKSEDAQHLAPARRRRAGIVRVR